VIEARAVTAVAAIVDRGVKVAAEAEAATVTAARVVVKDGAKAAAIADPAAKEVSAKAATRAQPPNSPPPS
jgi:hypothetical protein